MIISFAQFHYIRDLYGSVAPKQLGAPGYLIGLLNLLCEHRVLSISTLVTFLTAGQTPRYATAPFQNSHPLSRRETGPQVGSIRRLMIHDLVTRPLCLV